MDKPSRLFKAFADDTRLRILNLLTLREHCVCEFQGVLRLPQPKISRHLAYLRKTGLVRTRREGKMVLYSLAEPDGQVHAMLVRCLRTCFGEMKYLSQDLARGRKCKPLIGSKGCC